MKRPTSLLEKSARSLSGIGNRSEASGKSRPAFRSFEANSGNYSTKNSSGTNFRASPEGVKRRDALNKMIGKMDRFPATAVDSSYAIQAPRVLCCNNLPVMKVYCGTAH